MKRAAVLLAPLTVVVLVLPAGAAPAVPPPSATATFQTVHLGLDNGPEACDAAPYSFDQPALTAAWNITRPGHAATLTVAGTPPPQLTGCAQGIWTSAPLQVRKPGKVAAVSLTWSATQLDPYDKANTQTIAARFKDAAGRWGTWVNYLTTDLSTPLDTGSQHTASVAISYRGPVPVRNLIVQVRVQDKFSVAVTQVQQSVRISA